jgi:hypothetical protein
MTTIEPSVGDGGDIRICSEGHKILPEDIQKSGEQILPCGCPSSSTDARKTEGLA